MRGAELQLMCCAPSAWLGVALIVRGTRSMQDGRLYLWPGIVSRGITDDLGSLT